MQQDVLDGEAPSEVAVPATTRIPRRRVLAALLGMLALVVALVLALVQELVTGRTATSVRTWAVDLNSDPGDDVRLRASDRSVVGLNAWELERLQEIKQRSPQTTVLVYKDMASVRSYPGALDAGEDAALLPTGVGYAEASATDEGWFLTDASGQRLEWEDHPQHWHVDVGDAEYQQRWLDNVSDELDDHGWDGVLIDNALSRADLYTPGRPPSRYPTDDAMQTATRSMLAVVGPALQDRGFAVHANVGDGRLNPGLWEDWGSLITGPIEENFVTFRSGDSVVRLLDEGSNGWRRQVDALAATERSGQTPLVNIKGDVTDESTAVYGLASFLLVTEGRGSLSHDTNGWFPAFDYELGQPRGAYSESPQGVYRREFNDGLVLVNPSRSEVEVELPRRLVDGSGQVVATVRMPSGTGLVLRSAG